MLPTVAASDVAAIMHTAGVTAGVGAAFVSVAVAWKLLGKLKAWTLAGASLLSSGGNDDNDKCPADAPKGDNAVSPQSELRYMRLTASSLYV